MGLVTNISSHHMTDAETLNPNRNPLALIVGGVYDATIEGALREKLFTTVTVQAVGPHPGYTGPSATIIDVNAAEIVLVRNPGDDYWGVPGEDGQDVTVRFTRLIEVIPEGCL